MEHTFRHTTVQIMIKKKSNSKGLSNSSHLVPALAMQFICVTRKIPRLAVLPCLVL